MDKVHFVKELTVLGAAFQIDVKPLLEVYWDSLSGYSDNSMSKARAAHIRTGEFFPRVSNLINLIEGTGKENAHKAWGDVLKQLQNAAAASFDLATARVVTAMGGSVYLSHLTYRELEFKKKDFLEMYELQSDRSGNLEIANQQERITNG